ncbi:MAG TPA: NOP5/NOP56 family protein, partial [Candidatus Nanoarchaeia archaeon]|nr:NOP5/NOP56 family protein [Candidatus Nanoarchaeia archaeon]
MKFLFTNLLGAFVFDKGHQLIEEHPFRNLQDYKNRSSIEKRLQDKYKDGQKPEKEHLTAILLFFQSKKYFPLFYQQNLAFSAEAIRNSLSPDMLITQTVSNLDELDHILSILAKRLREWYELYLPEISWRLFDHQKFAEIISRQSKEESLRFLKLRKEDSLGGELSKDDLNEILLVAEKIGSLYQLRQQHEQYLEKVLKKLCPNFVGLAGTTLAARLLSHAGSLKHLASLPAGTIQLYGAEKALFRHIKTGARSPKYGLIFQHPLIQKAKKDLRGNAARKLANKLSLCAKLDYFKGEFLAPMMKKELEAKFS